MTDDTPFEIFVVATPGLEPQLAEEVVSLGHEVTIQPGGVTLQGDWPTIWRLNLSLRMATRVLVRIAEFRAMHLAQLDKRARRVDWSSYLKPGTAVQVDATCHASRIYHAGAARERITRAVADVIGPADEGAAKLRLIARIDDDLCTISLDTTGAALHQRGHKMAVGKAPLRENLAAAFLSICGYDGSERVIDPMCGSGTFVIEAAEIAAGLQPGRSRNFAFEEMPAHDAEAFAAMKTDIPARQSDLTHIGHDRDDGAIRMASANADRAGVASTTAFQRQAISDLRRPDGPAGLIMVNPPYGARIGNRKLLFALYGSLGQVLRERFAGWRVGIVTSDPGLAKATKLPFAETSPPIPLGGLKIRLYRTDAL